MVDTCGEDPTPTTFQVLKKLAESDTNFGVRLREGLRFQTYDGSAWVDADPLLWGYAPMLCRSINVVEHPERPGLFSVDYETSGFGQPTTTNDTDGDLLGTDDIQLSVSHRPRQIAAYRADPTVPATETLDTSATPDKFNVDADWHDGNDIGGRYVDINTAPLSITVDQAVITISFPIRYPYQEWDGTWGRMPLSAVRNDWISERRGNARFRRRPTATRNGRRAAAAFRISHDYAGAGL